MVAPLQMLAAASRLGGPSPAAPHTFGGQVPLKIERIARGLILAVRVSYAENCFCGTTWHLAASWTRLWICPRAAARCKRSPGSARSKPAAPLAGNRARNRVERSVTCNAWRPFLDDVRGPQSRPTRSRPSASRNALGKFPADASSAFCFSCGMIPGNMLGRSCCFRPPSVLLEMKKSPE